MHLETLPFGHTGAVLGQDLLLKGEERRIAFLWVRQACAMAHHPIGGDIGIGGIGVAA